MSQMTLFDIAEPANSPRYCMGDAIYRVILDTVAHYKIEGTFNVGVDIFGQNAAPGDTLWRYHLIQESGCHNVFGEYEMDKLWFDNLPEALGQAVLNCHAIEDAGFVLRSDQYKTADELAFLVNLHDKKVRCQIARVDANKVFEKGVYTYPFLHVFKTEKEAEKCYREKAGSIKGVGGVAVPFEPCDLYRVNDELWSGHEYAYRHGDWSCLSLNDNVQNPGTLKPKNLANRPTRHKSMDYER